MSRWVAGWSVEILGETVDVVKGAGLARRTHYNRYESAFRLLVA